MRNTVEITSTSQLNDAEFARLLSDEEVAKFLQLWLQTRGSTKEQLNSLQMRAESDKTSMIIWQSLNRLQAWSCDVLGIED